VAEAVIRLKANRERPALLGHPWIFSGAIAGMPRDLAPGGVVSVIAADGSFIGRGCANPRCAITVRLLTREDVPIDDEFLRRRVAAAAALREVILPAQTNCFRLLNGEGDGLPGVIADVYGRVAVLQCLTAGADALKQQLAVAIRQRLPIEGIYERSAGNVRREEGLGTAVGVLDGNVGEPPVEVRECGHAFGVDVRRGQKTGFFLDQRDNRRLVGELAKDRVVLNAFAYSGAFGVYAAAGGAQHVVSLETSHPALEQAQAHWSANGLRAEQGEFLAQDAFRYLRETDRLFDLLILDPPAFVRRRQEQASGARAYKDLHLWALRRAAQGALLMTFSCSQHVDADLFRKIVLGAARDVGREVQVLRHLDAGLDHPVALAHAEGVYLKGLLLHVS
jgi:23S rRNA (cytosine1962-C5)-methyltransferase